MRLTRTARRNGRVQKPHLYLSPSVIRLDEDRRAHHAWRSYAKNTRSARREVDWVTVAVLFGFLLISSVAFAGLAYGLYVGWRELVRWLGGS